MPADTALAWDGVPLNPEREGWQWAAPISCDFGPVIVWWTPEDGWEPDYIGLELKVRWSGWRYLGPCHTHASVAALVEAARRDGLRMAWDAVNALPKPAWKTTDYVEIWGDVRADCLNEIAAIRARSTQHAARSTEGGA